MPLKRWRALDQQIFAWVARKEIPGGAGLRRLTDLADHSALWMLIAAGMAATGRRRERRAALRGLLSIGLASLVANQPAKRYFARGRPRVRNFPSVRLPRQVPVSTSFPSGHAASAFAFAVGASAELPPLRRVPLFGLAGLVGFSRVYVGVHYPGDVVAGAALGAAVGLGSRKLWPLPATNPEAGPQQPRVAAPAAPDGEGLVLVVNPDAGSGLDRARLAERLPKARVIERGEDEDLRECLRAAAAGAAVLGVAGGDGSANAAAQVALETGLPLLVLPGGTLNHLCRDLGLESVDCALEALAAGRAVSADVGVIDDKPFVNTASFGGYPEFVADREHLEGRMGKLPAMLAAGARALRRATPSELEIDGRPVRAWLIFIGNCRYEPDGPAPSVRERFDDGLLDVRLLDAGRPFARGRLLAAVLIGRAPSSPALQAWTTAALHVRSVNGPLRVAVDGEVIPEDRETFTVSKRTGAIVLYTGSSRTA